MGFHGTTWRRSACTARQHATSASGRAPPCTWKSTWISHQCSFLVPDSECVVSMEYLGEKTPALLLRERETYVHLIPSCRHLCVANTMHPHGSFMDPYSQGHSPLSTLSVLCTRLLQEELRASAMFSNLVRFRLAAC